MSELSPPVTASSAPPVTEPASLAGTVADTLGLVVAPTTGRFEPATTNGRIRAGQLLGHITGLPAGTARIPWDGPEVRIIEHQAHAAGHAGMPVGPLPGAATTRGERSRHTTGWRAEELA